MVILWTVVTSWLGTFCLIRGFILRLENYQALLWLTFQPGKFLWEKTAPWITLTFLNSCSKKFVSAKYLQMAQIFELFFQAVYWKGPKSHLLFPSILLPRSVGSRPNPVRLKRQDPLFPPRGHLSELIERIGSYLETKAKSKTPI